MMRTIQWQFEVEAFESEESPKKQQNALRAPQKMEEEVDIESIQLKKYQNPLKDMQRQTYITLAQKFGSLLANQSLEEIARDLITEDFEVFILDSSGRSPVKFSKGKEEFFGLYKSIIIQNRRVREVNVDVEKSTVCLLCNYESFNENDGCVVEETAFEIYSIKEGIISKYRVSFGHLPLQNNQCEDPLEMNRKDKMLARVKKINYALAGKPNLEELSSLLDENTQYKIWRWSDFRCFTFSKEDFVSNYQKLEEKMRVSLVVPYELIADPAMKFITGTYVYHLEEISTGKKLIWLTSCIYEFDEDMRLTRMVQQGELHKEDNVNIPFEVYDRKKLEDRLRDSYTDIETSIDILYSEKTIYDCRLMTFGSHRLPNPGFAQGVKEIEKLINIFKFLKAYKSDFVKLVDVFVDYNHESYDTAFGIVCIEGPTPGLSNNNEKVNIVTFVRLAFENGKQTNSLQFNNGIRSPIPSLFDDKTFSCLNIK